MLSKKVSESGLAHMGEIIPHIVQTACAYHSEITFEVDNRHVNAKSIMGVMALASQHVQSMDVCVSGDDEAEAMEAIVGLLA